MPEYQCLILVPLYSALFKVVTACMSNAYPLPFQVSLQILPFIDRVKHQNSYKWLENLLWSRMALHYVPETKAKLQIKVN